MSGPAFKPTYSFLLVTLLVHSIALSQTNVRPHVNSSRALTPAAITVPFLPPVSYDLSSRAESVGAVDLNGDGKPDVTFNSECGFVLQLRNGQVIAAEADRDVTVTIRGKKRELRKYKPALQ